MSTSSLYSPDEDDEESSDLDDIAPRASQSAFPASSPRLQELALSSADEKYEPPSRSLSRNSKRIRLRSRANAWRALRKLPIGGYRELYKETCDDISQGSAYYTGDNLPTAQNGASLWTSLEKDRFFNALAKMGKSRCGDIATAIGSKSEMEVRDYIQLLHRSLEHQHIVERHTGSTVLGDIPAALEISAECCNALDEASEVVSMEEQRSERVAAKRRHGDMSLIDSDKADSVEENLEIEPDKKKDSSEIDTAARLFKFGNWIKTSERIFMNFGEPRSEDNWENIKFEGESPSLTSEAFLDFHTLAISLTRRLVQSSIFFALSRIRALESASNHPQRTVRTRDVASALNVLRMEHNSKSFWAGVSRRCSLNVIDMQNRGGWKSVPLSHHEVEERLSGYSPNSAASLAIADTPISTDAMGEQTDASPEAAPSSSGEESASSSDEEFSDPEEAHASALDAQASRSEEQRLWQILKSTASSHNPPEPHSKEGSQGPDLAIIHGKRKTREDLVDWRARTRYRSEWEEFGLDTITIEEEFAESQRKRRRIDSQPLPESDTSSDEDASDQDNEDASRQDEGSVRDESGHVTDESIRSDDRMDVDSS
ncbi:hypothetical protein FQN54_004231 [Arachnomyces sp. PD_36]|nr:hypothetical protein FQN54_004231 [Arachnomyces sp. PD_36]